MNRELRKVNRTLERDRTYLEREEKKLEQEIKKMAKEGNKEGCAILAKQLVQLRKQKTRSVAASSKIQGISAQNKVMGANVALADAMATSSKTMGAVNKLMQPQKIAQDMKAFEQANMKMGMTEEMINDTLDDIFADSDDEAESDKVVTQVLDEIGIEISGQMSKAPVVRGDMPHKSRLPTDAEIEAELAKLKIPQ
ncbi:UNVERIFIED_CONTAM: hypothetical protein PYX00_002438 [Menopon gallinae]|uniref:Charged multivesicular body protein 2B n=1 Tax=Menopon gallinae TaxID=328185 RepID=A0AAW2IGX6_9NEOP